MKLQISRPFYSVAVLSMLGAVPVAANAGEGPYIGIEGGYNYQNPENLRTNPSSGISNKFDSGFVGGLTLGYASPSGFRPELELDYRRNDIRKTITPAGDDTDVSGYNNAYTAFGNLWYDFKSPTGFFSVVHPYIGGGVGAARFGIRNFAVEDVPVAKDFNVALAYQGGAGIGFDLGQHVTASLDYRYLESLRARFETDGGGDFRARYRAHSGLLSIRYAFGEPRQPVAPPPPPPPAVVYAPPPPPPVVPVDGDDDHDGVPNSRDKCPGTPRGFKVDADGCIIEQTVVLRAVNFEFNSDKLTQPATETLDEVATALIGQPKLNVQIGGYTDSKGSDAYNLNLSAKRAKSVKAYLTGKGVNGDNLVSKGFGETAPIADNSTEEGRAENRRVEFVVLNKPATVKVLTKESTQKSKSAAEGSEPTKKTTRRKK